MTGTPSVMERRTFLRLAAAGVAGTTLGVPLSACGANRANDARPDPDRTPPPDRGARSSVLLAYFSRAGENYHYGGQRNLEVGNTEVLARMISARLDCDVLRIEAADPYPIWNVRAPMIMSTFTERHDFSGRTVFPVTTHAMSGLGTTEDDYADSCRGARFGPGLAVRGERVRSAGPAVDSWLRRAGALDAG
jgi:hypothetical protein